MSENQKKIAYGEHIELYPDVASAASATECTGLMPTPPKDAEALRSYQELHSMEIPKKLPGKRSFKSGVYDDKPEDIRM